LTTGTKIATVAFWVVTICVAAIFAWYNVRIDVARANPWLFFAALLLCAAAVFGVRECIRIVKGQSVVSSKLATLLFWLGVAYFFVVAALMAWAVLFK
jgi:hypothetical protein